MDWIPAFAGMTRELYKLRNVAVFAYIFSLCPLCLIFCT
jgi:hypothetical protein